MFSDLCEVGSSQGGLLSIAAPAHPGPSIAGASCLRNGRHVPDQAPPLAWPVIRQAVTVQLRHVFGFDA